MFALMTETRPIKPLCMAIIAILALSWLTSLIVTAHMPWYQGLAKPPYNPPDWAFGVVWPILYIMMTVAAWLVWQPETPQRQLLADTARKSFLIQLALNLSWTPLFFGLENPLFGLVWIAMVWFAVAVTLSLFWRLRPLAGLLLLPYLAWVSFAAMLNYAILVLN